MIGNHLVYTVHVPGTLAANLNVRFALPFPATLRHVSAVGSNANDATIAVGTSADEDGWLKAAAIGDSNTPAEFGLTNFDGALLGVPGSEYPSGQDGDIVVVTVDYDGAAGTAAQNVTIALTFAE